MKLFGVRYGDGDRIAVGGAVVRLAVNRRARRVSLRIDRARGEAVAVAPSLRRLADAAAFAAERAAWIERRLAEIPQRRVLAAGEEITIFGAPCRLVPDGRRPRLVAADEGGAGLALVGCGKGAVDLQLVARAAKARARQVFAERIETHRAALDVARAPRLVIADARSRWGSCVQERPGRAAAIRLSWRLALAPFAVADYVAAHECAHLIEANHGPRFWALVRGLVGDERPHRAWLRQEGPKLHAFA